MSKLVLITFLTHLTFIYGCSSNSKNAEAQLNPTDILFNLSDKNGQYNVRVATGFVEKTKSYTTKRIMELPNKSVDHIIEQSVSISSLGVVKKKSVILRPKISQYSVWFDGKKYFTELKINTSQKAIDVKMKSPESQWNGSKQVKFPSTRLLPCFFNQIIECAKVNGFISKASKAQAGVLNMLVVWEGYPYLNETLSDFTTELFSDAQLEYDGKTKQSERRFSLRVAGQAITYVLDEQDNMIKMFWVSQGISMVGKSKKSLGSSLESSSESAEGEIE